MTTTTDPTEAAIRNAYREGAREARERADTELALRIADARLSAAIDALHTAGRALREAPAMYATEVDKGRHIADSIARDRRALVERREAVRAELERHRRGI